MVTKCVLGFASGMHWEAERASERVYLVRSFTLHNFAQRHCVCACAHLNSFGGSKNGQPSFGSRAGCGARRRPVLETGTTMIARHYLVHPSSWMCQRRRHEAPGRAQVRTGGSGALKRRRHMLFVCVCACAAAAGCGSKCTHKTWSCCCCCWPVQITV